MFTGTDPPLFAFIIHPRDVGDLTRWPGSRLVRDYSAGEADFVRKINTMEPVVIGDIVFGPGSPRGELLGVMRMPDRIVGPGGQAAVAQGVRVAAKRGVRTVGLGALTAPITAAGRTLMRDLPVGVTLTTGNAFTAAVAHRNVMDAAEALGLGTAARVAVLGATGSVGVPASHLLVDEGFRVSLFGRNANRLRATVGDLRGRADFATDLAELRSADMVLVLTSGGTSRIRSEHLADGTVVIDVAQPANVGPELRESLARRAVRVVEGGLARIPGYRCTYDLNISDPAGTFACLAETYILARSGVTEHSVGAIPPERARRFARMAAWHGVRVAPLPLGPEIARTPVTTGPSLPGSPGTAEEGGATCPE